MRNPHPLPRHIAIDGTTNFRDLGGYVGADGRRVRWRTVFRSDHLAGLTEQGLQELQQLGVHGVADFRGQQEREAARYDWPQLQVHALSIEPTIVQQALGMLASGGRMTVADTVAVMQDTYRSFVREHAGRFAEFFRLLLESQRPVVFHCTAGKDRTGWAAALLLEALGVSRSDIRQDYLLTNEYYRRPPQLRGGMAQHLPQEILDVVWRVQPEFLDSAYAEAERECGSMQAYLQDVIGLDAAALLELRTRYLLQP